MKTAKATTIPTGALVGASTRKGGMTLGVRVREKLKGSGEYWLFIRHGGLRKSKKVGDKRLALELAKKIEAKLVLGEFNLDKEEMKRPTFKEYAAKWLALPHDWKDSTRINYEGVLNNNILPRVGHRRLNEITRKDVRALFDNLLAGGLSPSTVGIARVVISGVFGYAVDSELVETNPCHGLKVQGNRKRNLKTEPLTEEESILLLEVASHYQGGRFYAPLLSLLRTGLRIGELQALQWADVDFNGRFIEVRQSWRHGRLTETKNRKHRRVDITPHLAETLNRLRTEQKKSSLKKGASPTQWVFGDVKDEMLCRETLRRALQKCLEGAGLRRVRTHDLRHTYATIRLLRGHNIADVSYQLGHSSISITHDVYCHWIPGKFKREVDELDRHPAAPYRHPEGGSANWASS
ncbi:tyrosine-type recombinase/integrase [Thermodesulfobacteriota bacterium]